MSEKHFAERLERLGTETVRPELADLDLRSTSDLVSLMIGEQKAVDEALAHAAPHLAMAVDAIAARMQRGGRIIYLGAGTSGRLAAMDAAECPPTFGIAPERVIALVAGGQQSLDRARESAEDNEESAVRELQAAGLTRDDAVVGISASGRTPFVAAGLTYARENNALTIAVSNNESAAISPLAELAIELPTGPEVLAGSTRLKAGSAQKVVLGILSTLVMVRLGRTYGGLMVNVQSVNNKLADRSRRIVVEATGFEAGPAAAALESSEGDVKVAIVMLLAGVDVQEARRRLADDASVRDALRG
jgi:N-acetylmuramic acid 6-phosphate etherase